MNLARLSILALFVPGLLCVAQDSDSAAKPAAPAADQAPSAQVQAAQADASPAPAPAQAPGAAPDSYIIGASDELAVTVWKETSMSGTNLVRPDGKISMPLLGDVQAAGLTPLQLSTQIATMLKKYIQNPNVSVVVAAIHSKVVYLLGEVGKKGPLEMTPGMTMLQAIASGGGLTDYANTKKIYILRDEDGKHEKIPVRYKDALKGDGALDLVLKPGDTIVVP